MSGLSNLRERCLIIGCFRGTANASGHDDHLDLRNMPVETSAELRVFVLFMLVAGFVTLPKGAAVLAIISLIGAVLATIPYDMATLQLKAQSLKQRIFFILLCWGCTRPLRSRASAKACSNRRESSVLTFARNARPVLQSFINNPGGFVLVSDQVANHEGNRTCGQK